mgnify:CR=1 FL=1
MFKVYTKISYILEDFYQKHLYHSILIRLSKFGTIVHTKVLYGVEFSLSASVMNVVSTRVYCKVHRAHCSLGDADLYGFWCCICWKLCTWPCAKTSLIWTEHSTTFFENPLLRGQTCFEFTRSWFFRCSNTGIFFTIYQKIQFLISWYRSKIGRNIEFTIFSKMA